MLRKCKWLVGLMTVALMLPMPVLADELSGSFDIGVSSVDITDDGSKVNEYVKGNSDDGLSMTNNLELEVSSKTNSVELSATSGGVDDHSADLEVDLGRIIRFDASYNSLEHQLDHDQINYLDAAIQRKYNSKTTAAQLPGVPTSTGVPSFVLVDPDGSTDTLGTTGAVYWGAASSVVLANYANANGNGDEYVIQTGGATLAGEDLTPEKAFSIVRKELETGMEVALPFAPGVTFDVGFRHETREGTEQAISMSKCAGCHVTGSSKEVDEETRDLKAGLTGKFGLLTLRYELTDREFINNATASTNVYDPVIKPALEFDNATFDNRMSYDYGDGPLPYDVTPESEKQTHMFKARVDMPQDTTLVGSYLSSEVESNKTDEPGIFSVNTDKLTTKFDAYGLKATTRLTDKIRINAKFRASESEGDNYDVTFYPITAPTSPAAGITFSAPKTTEYTSSMESEATRDEIESALDMVWRLSPKTTMRLGYGYDVVDRENEELGETTTNTFKAKINSRAVKNLAIRFGYEFQDIDDPYHNPEAANVPVTDSRLQNVMTPTKVDTGIDGYIVAGNSDLYGTSYYDARTDDLSNQPETVHEAKFNATWSPAARFAATLNFRMRMEENALVSSTWEQTTIVPTLSGWYGVSDNLSLTAAYNYFDQRSETAFCQGFYDG